MDTVRNAYERVSYPPLVHPLTDVARIEMICKLVGLPVTSAQDANVLDIGCGSGVNLLVMAERFPRSRFVGIDFSEHAIAKARDLARHAQLSNVRFEHADLLQWNPGDSRYDIIIAYGLFSWVSDPVKERLLQVCQQCLTPRGVACISYMTYPGCKQLDAFRDLLCLRTETLNNPTERVTEAHRLLDFLQRAFEQLPNWSHSRHLQDLAEGIRRKAPEFLLLDDLGVVRDPCYFLQFVQWAAEHELQYLADCDFPMMFLENLPPQTARELAAWKLGQLETEQIIDYIVNRSFRCSLVARTENTSQAGKLNAGVMRKLYYKPILNPVAPGMPDDRKCVFATATGERVEVLGTTVIEFLRALSQRPENCSSFEDIVRLAQQRVGRAFTVSELDHLCDDLTLQLIRRQIYATAHPCFPTRPLPTHPRLTPLRMLLTQQLGILPTAFQEAIQLSEEQQAFCKLLDGTRSLDRLRESCEFSSLRCHGNAVIDQLYRSGCFCSDQQ
jgi:SAM-dependent methyltransferase